MEHERVEQDERERSGVARGQNVLYVLPHDAAAVAQFLDPALERIDADAPDTQLLVLTPDAESAVTIAETATRARTGAPARVLPVTGGRRAARLLRARPATVLAGTPADLLALIRGSAVKLDRVRTLIIAWADVIADAAPSDALEAVMAEVPKDAARVVVTSQLTPAVDALIERYARRARRTGAALAPAGEAIDLRYVAVAPQSRPAALRRLLDDLDPERTAVYVRSDDTAREVETALRVLGVAADERSVVITRGEPVADATLTVLYEQPLERAALHALVVPGAMAIALVTPRQLPALRALAAGGVVTPFTLSGPSARARAREEQVRDELRAVLAGGIATRELLALEPLLVEHDGVEIAAAALRLLERERERAREASATPAPATAGTRAPARESERAGAAATARLFVNAGTRDNVTPRDLVGAIANEAGISGDRIGKIELRDTHSLVEIAADVAEQAAAALSGTTLRGRRLAARVDTERRSGGERGERGERGGRPPRGGERGGERGRGRGGPRGDRPRQGGRRSE